MASTLTTQDISTLSRLIRAAHVLGDARAKTFLREVWATSPPPIRDEIDSLVYHIESSRYELVDKTTVYDPSRTYVDIGEETMPIIAKVNATFDYSGDDAFVYPAQRNLNVYGPQKDLTQNKSFKDLVYKAWGKVVQGVDPSKTGGYTLLGEAWVSGKSQAYVRDVATFGNLPSEYKAGMLVSDVRTEFSAEIDEEVIVLSMSYGRATLAFVLVNRKVDANTSNPSEALLPLPSRFEIDVLNVRFPFPYNVNGDYNSQFSTYTNCSAKVMMELNDNYGVMMIATTDFGTKASNAIFFAGYDNDNYVIPAYLRLGVQDKNCFNAVADVLHFLKENDVLKLTGKLPKVVKIDRSRNHILVKAIAGSEVESTSRPAFTPPSTKPPYGLAELPGLPKGYHFIGDASGFVYITDAHGVQLLLPYDVYDLQSLIQSVEAMEAELHAQGKQPNGAVFALRREIDLIRKLFQHQSQLLSGKSYTYDSLAAINWTVESPFAQHYDDDDDSS